MTGITMGGFVRLSKNAARKAYERGAIITMAPCRMIPDSWASATVQTGKTLANKDFDNTEFDRYVNAFEYYNCCHETGYYTSFYIKEDKK